ncbi:MAG TPA: twin-arginine translocase subunit TatC [Balneolaceae bacterium]
MQKDPPEAGPVEDRTGDMAFLDHVEELRWRIIKGLGGVALGIAIAFFFRDFLIDTVILGPAKASFFIYEFLPIDAISLELQSRRLPGQFFTYWGTLIIFGGIIGSPIFFYQMWGFIEPALGKTEKWRTYGHTLFITFFFLLGVAFGYLILVPFALQFFAQFQISEMIHNDFDINKYFSALSTWTLSCGIIFQLPVITYFLSKFGLVTPEFLKEYRRHAIVLCFILAAALTPPDPVSQTLVAIPLLLLYQLSIWISKVGIRKRNKEMEEAFKG